ncbi:non-ribosomal peptide synthetase [Micromonosporaceae bacterium Da 78-11]
MDQKIDGTGLSIASLVAQWVTSRPAGIAVCDELSSSVTYAELWSLSGTLTTRLVADGVRAGDYVAVDLPRSVGLVVAVLGIVRAGAAYVALDAHAPADRRAEILAETGARVVLTAADLDRLLATRDDSAPAPGIVPVGLEDPVYVAYTSGSTGRPKGVVIPHRAVRRLVVGQSYCPLGPGDRVAASSNPAFDATTFEIWSALCAGATVVVLPTLTDRRLEEWIALVERLRVTAMFLTTALFQIIARERPDAFRTIRCLMTGGEQLAIESARAVLAADPPARLINIYGPTETTTFATFFDCTAASLRGLDRVPVGIALAGTDLYIMDGDPREVAGVEVGELCIGGPGVATGYLGQPELTAQSFVEDPATGTLLYRTGDLARWRPGGVVELLGRRDRQVKLRGYRVELEEIERAATGTGLASAAFVEVVGTGPAAALVGFFLPAAGARDDASELTEALGRSLPDYMVPARWVALADLPVGSTGKVDRARLLGLLEPAAAVAPADDPVIRRLQEIWGDVLGRPTVRPEENFIDLGGNSILAVQVASRLRQRLLVEVEPGDVLLANSMADLAETLRAGGA